MDVRIGVQNAARELSVDADQERDDIVKDLRAARAQEGGLLLIEDKKGGTVAVPAAKVAYIEFSSESGRAVGFGA